ncbi:hypothetical protein KEJ39_01985 [Candidatus Bathyarchaeota archaeon]|nr:hypothetical protein [Candidatus Bathyarchaeota archaeon]
MSGLIERGKQSYTNIEIIVVDRLSKDKKVEIAKKFGAKVFQIRADERSEQMNYGTEKVTENTFT